MPTYLASEFGRLKYDDVIKKLKYDDVIKKSRDFDYYFERSYKTPHHILAKFHSQVLTGSGFMLGAFCSPSPMTVHNKQVKVFRVELFLICSVDIFLGFPAELI